ncbi:nucleosome assembly protein-domain-containing protein [Thermoascus aurantiacus ATCC 26904]
MPATTNGKTKANGKADGENGNKSLLERVEAPSDLPKETRSKIARLEYEFARAEFEQLRQSVPKFRPLYEKRNALIASTPELQGDFWRRVFANAPAEIDEYILPSDAAILGQSLKNLTVERFEVDDQGNGEPRSLRFTFEFETGDENPYFEDAKLVKDFYWRREVTRTAKGKRRTWEGLVSEPVRIHWKKDMDPTKGLLDAACDLAEAEKKQGTGADRKKLPEYERLVKKVEELEAEKANAEDKDDDDEEGDDEDPLAGRSPAGVSFFAWFGYRGRDVSAEKSKEAEKEEEERWAKIAKGEEVDLDEDDDDDEDDEEEDDLEEAEIFPDGEGLANALAEELWPNALRYYEQSFDIADDDDLGLEELDDDEDDDEDEDDEEGEKDEEEEARPRKRVKKT